VIGDAEQLIAGQTIRQFNNDFHRGRQAGNIADKLDRQLNHVMLRVFGLNRYRREGFVGQEVQIAREDEYPCAAVRTEVK